MLQHTFQLVGGIGPARERELWRDGIESWRDLPQRQLFARRPDWFSGAHEARLCEAIDRARQQLDAGDLGALIRCLPSRERWRLFGAFADRAVFFDIETDGSQAQTPTTVSLFHAQGVELFIAGRNLDAVPRALAKWPLWVTFNGTRFDEPVLRRHLPDLGEPALHLDLRFWGHALGLRGGLKRLEESLGFGRPEHLHGVNGLDAIHLWERFRASGDREALRRLCEYNLYDAIQLRTLCETLYNRAIDALCAEVPESRLGASVERLNVFSREAVLPEVARIVGAL